jgi:hypothetical protein
LGLLVTVTLLSWLVIGAPLDAGEGGEEPSTKPQQRIAMDVLSAAQWKQIDISVDRGLAFLARHQQDDGSFEAPPVGQPGITSLCVLALLSRGHVPNQGPYGDNLSRAIDFVLSTQQGDGLFSQLQVGRNHQVSLAAMYNHGIAGLMLSEVYGMAAAGQHERIGRAIPKAVAFLRPFQSKNKSMLAERGGWRYLHRSRRNNSDVSATSWQLMFLRSARNAEFAVPKKYIEEALGFVKRCFNADKQAFEYHLPVGYRSYVSGGVVGGGIVALSLGGEHQSAMAENGGKWILAQSFDDYNKRPHKFDRYHYSAFYCSQAMFQLGGEYWAKFYPRLTKTLVAHQRQDGSWQPESTKDTHYGNVYTSALTVLALTPPYQLLPIYQR